MKQNKLSVEQINERIKTFTGHIEALHVAHEQDTVAYETCLKRCKKFAEDRKLRAQMRATEKDYVENVAAYSARIAALRLELKANA